MEGTRVNAFMCVFRVQILMATNPIIYNVPTKKKTWDDHKPHGPEPAELFPNINVFFQIKGQTLDHLHH